MMEEEFKDQLNRLNDNNLPKRSKQVEIKRKQSEQHKSVGQYVTNCFLELCNTGKVEILNNSAQITKEVIDTFNVWFPAQEVIISDDGNVFSINSYEGFSEQEVKEEIKTWEKQIEMKERELEIWHVTKNASDTVKKQYILNTKNQPGRDLTTAQLANTLKIPHFFVLATEKRGFFGF